MDHRGNEEKEENQRQRKEKSTEEKADFLRKRTEILAAEAEATKNGKTKYSLPNGRGPLLRKIRSTGQILKRMEEQLEA
jgi:hypothetical protein